MSEMGTHLAMGRLLAIYVFSPEPSIHISFFLFFSKSLKFGFQFSIHVPRAHVRRWWSLVRDVEGLRHNCVKSGHEYAPSTCKTLVESYWACGWMEAQLCVHWALGINSDPRSSRASIVDVFSSAVLGCNCFLQEPFPSTPRRTCSSLHRSGLTPHIRRSNSSLIPVRRA
jgi:hypothetical protein